MHKMKKKSLYTWVLLLGFLGGCSSNPETTTNSGIETVTHRYFSLNDYFLEEAKRLNSENPDVHKTVLIDTTREEKLLKIENWETELQNFIESDINKDAWVNSYSIDSTGTLIIYTALEPQLKTRKISLNKNEEGEITEIEIVNTIENNLYNSEQILKYVPNDYYSIDLNQKVRIMGQNTFHVLGKFQ